MDLIISQNSVVISINDILDELMSENKRLFNELLFANKLLIELKVNLNLIHKKFETIIDLKDKQIFNGLIRELNEWSDKTLDEMVVTGSDGINGQQLGVDMNVTKRESIETKSGSIKRKSGQKGYTNSLSENSKRVCNEEVVTDPQLDLDIKPTTREHRQDWTNSTITTGSQSKTKPNARQSNQIDYLDDTTRQYLCPIPDCRMGFETNKEISNHIRLAHDYRVHLCGHTGCGKAFKSQTYLQDHQLSHSNERPFGCLRDGCDDRFKTEKALNSHIERIHTDDQQSYQCPDCQQVFKSLYALNGHRNRVHSNEHNFCCPYDGCDQRFRTSTERRDHKIAFHKELPVQTLPIPDPLLDPNSPLLLKQNNFDEQSGKFLCPNPDCREGFEVYSKLCRHFYNSHSITRSHLCSHNGCGKAFKTKYKLRLHETVHSDDRPYGCPRDGCLKRFKSNHDLGKHLKDVHIDVKSYECDVCHKTFKTKKGLITHQKRHNNICRFKCPYDGCTEKFRTYLRLQSHKVTAHNQLILVLRCEWPGCDFTAIDQRRINEHKVKHTGERPYLCQWPDCGKRFPRKGALNLHHMIHNNEKPYVCHWPGCDYKANNCGRVREHLRDRHKCLDQSIQITKLSTLDNQ